MVERMVSATRRGYNLAVSEPRQALDDLLAANPSLERADQAAQLKVLRPALKPEPFDETVLKEWSTWASDQGLLPEPLEPKSAFDLGQ
jgi:ABC-type nitrate/sulfonate/bicarbonate transport system substrate-binding protein